MTDYNMQEKALISTLECMSRLPCAGTSTEANPGPWKFGPPCPGPNKPVEHMLTCHMCQTIIEIRDALGDLDYKDPTL